MLLPIERQTLTLENTETIEGLKSGTGTLPCVIVGPGSFYLNKLSSGLKKHITFYTFDSEWSHRKDAVVDSREIEHLNFNSFIVKTIKIIEALKKQCNYENIGIIGFSAYSLIAFNVAIEMGKDQIAFVISVGPTLCKVDPEFKESNMYFQEYADAERQQRYKLDNENFEKLKSGAEDAIALPDSNFIEETIVDKKTRRLTPTSYFGEFVRSLATKQIKDYKNSKTVHKLINEWKYNSLGKILSAPMRLHYFELLSDINPIEMFAELIEIGIPVMSAYGEYDFTAPPPTDIQKWNSHLNFFSKFYPDSTHYPSWECEDKFDSDVFKFLIQHQLLDHNSAFADKEDRGIMSTRGL